MLGKPPSFENSVHAIHYGRSHPEMEDWLKAEGDRLAALSKILADRQRRLDAAFQTQFFHEAAQAARGEI